MEFLNFDIFNTMRGKKEKKSCSASSIPHPLLKWGISPSMKNRKEIKNYHKFLKIRNDSSEGTEEGGGEMSPWLQQLQSKLQKGRKI